MACAAQHDTHRPKLQHTVRFRPEVMSFTSIVVSPLFSDISCRILSRNTRKETSRDWTLTVPVRDPEQWSTSCPSAIASADMVERIKMHAAALLAGG